MRWDREIWAIGCLLLLIGAMARPTLARDDLSSASPLFFRTFAVGRLDVLVEEVLVVPVLPLTMDREPSMRRSPKGQAMDRVHRFGFQVLQIHELIARDDAVPQVCLGDTLIVHNPYVEEPVPFRVGDRVRARFRLVLPDEYFDPDDSRAQWWFFPEGESEEIFPPRHPFLGVRVIP